MGQIFTDLSYNNKTLKPIGRPIEDIKGLYKEKNDNYNYVVDTKNKTQTALNSIPALEKDKHLVSSAKNEFNTKFDEFGEALEDKVIDTKGLVNDLNNNYGLTEVQRNALAQSEYENGLKDRFEKGDISEQRYHQAIKFSRDNYSGVKRNEETGLYTGSFRGREVANYIDVAKDVADVLKGFKANEVPLHINGEPIIPDPSGNGYVIAGTTKSVSEADLVNSAKSYISSNANIQSQFNEDIFYELQNKNVTTDEIKNVLKGGVSTQLLTQLGITSEADLANLDKILEGKDLNSVYGALRKDQLTNEAMRLGVEKEGFTEYEQKYIKPLTLESSDPNSPNYKAEKGLSTVAKMFTQQRISPEDFSKIKEGKEATQTLLVNKKAELNNLIALQNKGEKISPNKISQIQQSIADGNRDLEDIERQERSIRNYVIDKAKDNVPLKQYYNNYRNNITRKRAEEFAEYKRKYTSNGAIPSDAIFGGSDKDLLTVSEFNEKVTKLLDEKYETKSYKDFENEAIYKYSQKDTNSWSPNANADFDSATRYVANQFKDKIGGELEEQNVTRDVFAFFTDDISNTTNTPLKEFQSLVNNLFTSTPESFTFKGKGLEAVIEEELDVNMADVDLSKATIKPVIEFIDGKPAYVVQVKGNKDNNGKYPDLGKVVVNFEGAATQHEDLIRQVVSKQAMKYANKNAESPLQGEDLTNYRKLAKSYINTISGGKELDKLNIYTAEPDVPLKWNITDKLSTNIVPKKTGTNFGDVDFYLQNNNGLMLGVDANGRKGWYNQNESNITFDSFSGADELKEVMGSQLLENSITKKDNIKVNVNPNAPIDFNKLIQTESSGNPNAVNTRSGATGLTQIMPIGSEGGTPIEDFNKANNTTYTNKDLKNPQVSKDIGKWYLDTKIPKMLDTYNLPNNSMYKLMAYNWGIGNVKDWHNKGANLNDIPSETKNYINKILSTN